MRISYRAESTHPLNYYIAIHELYKSDDEGDIHRHSAGISFR